MARSIAAFETWRDNTFAAMSDGHFRILFVGTLFATFAYMMMFLAMSVVSYDLSGTNTAVGVIGTGVGISMLLAPFGGVIADRMNRKWVIVIGQGGGAAMLAITGILLLLGQMTLPLMFVLMLLLGFTFVVMGPARNAFTADLVGPNLIGNAIVLSQLSHTIGQPFSPFIAALLLESAAGSGGTYLVMGALVAVGVFTVAVMPNRRRHGDAGAGSEEAAQRRGVLADIVDGARYVWRRRSLRLMLLMFVSTVVIGFLFRILTPAFLDQHLDRPTTDMGQLFLVNGIAAAIISFIVAGMATTRWAWPITLVSGRLAGGWLPGAGRVSDVWPGDDRDGDSGTGAAGTGDDPAGADHDEYGVGVLRPGDGVHDDGLGRADGVRRTGGGARRCDRRTRGLRDHGRWPASPWRCWERLDGWRSAKTTIRSCRRLPHRPPPTDSAPRRRS